MRDIKFRAWVKWTEDLRWNWAYHEAEKLMLPEYEETAELRDKLLLDWDEKHKPEERYSIKHYMDYSDNVSVSCAGKIIRVINCDVIDLMQFTGLKDKNGNEIYEGDILECQDMHDSNIDLWSSHWQDENTRKPKMGVSWDEKAYFIIPHDLECWAAIGNIYENPELLESNRTKTKE